MARRITTLQAETIRLNLQELILLNQLQSGEITAIEYVRISKEQMRAMDELFKQEEYGKRK